MNNMTLFRDEARKHRVNSWTSRPRINHLFSADVYLFFCVAVAAGVILCLTFGTYTRKAHTYGIVEADRGTIRIPVLEAGRIEGLKVAEGEHLSKGDVIYYINSDKSVAGKSERSQILLLLDRQLTEIDKETSSQEKLSISEKRSIEESISTINTQIQNLSIINSQMTDYIDQAESDVRKYQSMLERGLIGNKDYDSRVDILREYQRYKHDVVTQSVEITQRSIELKGQLSTSNDRLQNTLSELRARRAIIQQQIIENEAERLTAVTAPISGNVTTIIVKEGQMVPAGIQSLSIVPDDSRIQLSLRIRSSDIGFVNVNDKAMIRYAAYPYQKFGKQTGFVSEVGNATLAPTDIELGIAKSVSEGDDSIYRIVVRPNSNTIRAYGQDQPIRIGMRVDVDILLDRWRLWEWLVEPLYAQGTRGD